MAFSRPFLRSFLKRQMSSKAAVGKDGKIDPNKFFSHGDPEQIEKSIVMWKRMAYFFMTPALLICATNVIVNHGEPERIPFVPYDYLRVRTKKFPWGDGNHSLFHNKHVNALPDGYED